MKRRIVLALCVAVGIGLTLMMPEVQVHSADKEQRRLPAFQHFRPAQAE
jgi:hypothetical protein